jgi:hypothetical protein
MIRFGVQRSIRVATNRGSNVRCATSVSRAPHLSQLMKKVSTFVSRSHDDLMV